MTTEKKFFVEMKNKSGEYEPIGVMSYDEAIQLEFTTHHAIRMKMCYIDEKEDQLPTG